MSWKQWDIGEVVEAGDFQSYIQDQTVQVYADSAARDAALGGAVAEGMVSYLQDTNAVEAYDGSAWASVGQDLTTGTAGYTALSNGPSGLSYQPVSHNYIINGAFDVWQRGTSFTEASSYVSDRWGIAATTSTATITQQSFTENELSTAGFGEAKFYIRHAVTSGDTAGSRYLSLQRIEDRRTLAGQTATVTFFAKAATGTPQIGLELFQASSESAVTGIGATAITISTTWARYSQTITIPSNEAGFLGGAESHLGLALWLDAGSDFDARASSIGNQSNTFDIWGVQLEAGDTATPFKRNQPNLQGELAACQRYFQKIKTDQNYGYFAPGVGSSSTVVRFMQYYLVPMRSIPALNTEGNFQTAEGGVLTITSISNPTASTNQAMLLDATVSGATVGRGYYLRANNDNTAAINLSAEL